MAADDGGVDPLEPEAVESLCWEKLAGITDPEKLQEICAGLEIQVPATHVGKRNFLYKLLLKHLNSDAIAGSEDEGMSTFLKLSDLLKDISLKVHSPSGSESGEDDDRKIDIKIEPKMNDKNAFYEFQKLKELKINGKIGGVGEKDKLSYISLSYQISNAKKLGYSEEMICGAVIKAITPGSHLRTYLESKHSLTLSSLIEIMRSHFREKDSTSIFSELSNAAQAANESCLEFIIRLMCLREKVVSLSEEEGCPYDRKLVGQRFSHTVLTGLRNNNIRNELRSFLKRKSFSDEALLKVVSEAVTNETEHFEKTEKKNAKVNIIDAIADQGNDKFTKRGKDKDTTQNPLPQQIKDMKLLHEQEMGAVKIELQEIKTLLYDVRKSENVENYRYKPRKSFKRKCQNCYTSGAPTCFHCFKCGSSEHRMANCPGAGNEHGLPR